MTDRIISGASETAAPCKFSGRMMTNSISVTTARKIASTLYCLRPPCTPAGTRPKKNCLMPGSA